MEDGEEREKEMREKAGLHREMESAGETWREIKKRRREDLNMKGNRCFPYERH